VEDAVLQPPAQDRQIKGTFSTCLHLQSIPASIPGVFPLFCEGKKSPFLFPLVSSSSIFDSETARVENTVHPPPVQGRRIKIPFPGASQLQSNQASSPSIFAREKRREKAGKCAPQKWALTVSLLANSHLFGGECLVSQRG